MSEYLITYHFIFSARKYAYLIIIMTVMFEN